MRLNLYDTTVSLNHVSATYTIKLEKVAGSTNTNIASVTADKGIYSATVDNVNKQIKVVTARHTSEHPGEVVGLKTTPRMPWMLRSPLRRKILLPL